ncbi:hypothetical protein [Roseicella aquatilis]|uniref:DUF5666 domain-containing protein n=1 Tax=Roseicella aquatilis TaxID=2527868 RepID=A0A4R4D3I4_9PROT|nr:hypothetical protein [Roseicella aquatilis]TCZ53145.1 hypothetical protein EXY23_25270 [Roseicella aquatilis]
MRFSPLLFLGAALALPLAAGAQPRPAAVAQTAETVSVIEAVDQRERSVVLRTPEGQLRTLFLGKEVRNLPQVKAGDKVVTRVTQSVEVQMAKPGLLPGSGEAVGVAPPGSMPGVAYLRGARGVMVFRSFNRSANRVTMADEQGREQSFDLRDPKMRRFARGLRRGDKVDVSILEAVTIDVVR